VPELQLRIEESAAGTGTLAWQGASDPDALVRAVGAAAEEVLAAGRFRRLEISLPAGDHIGRRAALRAGFRLEGVRRAVVESADGGLTDLVLFGRLASDVVGGPTGFSGVMNSALPKKRLIAHVLMRDSEGRILLCETRFKSDWELPGGIVEPGEPPRVAAEREVLEELGVALAVGRLLVADWMPPYLGWEDAMELIFDGGLVTSEQLQRYVLQPSEILRIRLCTLEEARQLVTPLSHRRLTVASGLTEFATGYLENGSPWPPLGDA
jgi:8-oxo-dGTP pyrophosphatase MutT (NUDIX family)